MSDLTDKIEAIMLKNGIKDVCCKETNNFIIIRGFLKEGCALSFQTDKMNNNTFCTILSCKQVGIKHLWQNSNVDNFQKIIDSAKSRIGQTPNSYFNKVNAIILTISLMMIASLIGSLVSRLYYQQKCFEGKTSCLKINMESDKMQ